MTTGFARISRTGVTTLMVNARNDPLMRNSLFIMLSTATMAGFGFFFWLLVAHLYTPAQVGVASTLVSSMNFIIYFSQLGFNSTFLRMLPAAEGRERDEHITAGLLLVGVFAGLAATVFVFSAPHFAPALGLLTDKPLHAVGFIVLTACASLNILSDSVYIAYRSAGYNLAFDGVLGSVVQLALPLAVVGLGTFGIYASQGLGALVAFSASLATLLLRFRFRPVLRIRVRAVLTHLRGAWGNYVGNLLNILPTVIVPIIVLNKLDATAAGFYYLSFTMASLLFTIAIAVSQSMLSESSYAGVQMRSLVARSSAFMLAVMVPASAVFVFAGPLLLRMFGKEYATGAVVALQIFGVTGPFVGAYILASVLLQILGWTRFRIATNALYAVVICGFAQVAGDHGLSWIAVAWLIGNGLTAVVIIVGLLRRRRTVVDQPVA